MSRKITFFVAFVIGFIALGLFMAGCASPDPAASQVLSNSVPVQSRSASSPAAAPRQTAPTSAADPGPPAPTPAAVGGTHAGIDHVVVIVEENKPASSILGDAAAPYINKLATDYALADNYRAVTHPSLPNYLALTSGTNAGITDDCTPGASCTARVPNIADEIGRSGRTWKMYAESMPAPCTAGNSDPYAVKHNPFMYYPSVTDNKASCAAHVVPLTQLSGDLKAAASLPNYVFISPNLCNDMHDCPVATGDAWLSHQVPAILASHAFTSQNSLLVITWDEGADNNNTVSTIFAGPAARRAYRSGVAYSHYSLLHTIESLWGLAPLTDNDRNAPVMSDLLN